MEYFSSDNFDTKHNLRIKHATHVMNTLQTLFFQFLFTFGMVTVVSFNKTLYLATLTNATRLVFIGGICGLLTIFYMSACKRNTYLQLAVFTFFETMVVCAASVMYGQDVVVMALLATFGIVSGLGIYAMTTRTNYTGYMGFLFSCLSCLLLMSLLNILLGSQIVRIFELYAGTLLFFGYIVFDVQYYLTEHANKRLLNDEDLHIEAALNIYLDVINIFLRLMEIISSNKDNNSDRRNRKNRFDF